MTILTAGMNLAKNVFAVHGVNKAGKAEVMRPAVPRYKLHALVASLPPCVIGMESCSGATAGRGCSRLRATLFG